MKTKNKSKQIKCVPALPCQPQLSLNVLKSTPIVTYKMCRATQPPPIPYILFVEVSKKTYLCLRDSATTLDADCKVWMFTMRVRIQKIICGVVYCDFVTYLFDILGQVWYLIVSIPDRCCLAYFGCPEN